MYSPSKGTDFSHIDYHDLNKNYSILFRPSRIQIGKLGEFADHILLKLLCI